MQPPTYEVVLEAVPCPVGEDDTWTWWRVRLDGDDFGHLMGDGSLYVWKLEGIGAALPTLEVAKKAIASVYQGYRQRRAELLN